MVLYFVFPTAQVEDVRHPRFMTSLHYWFRGMQLGLYSGIFVGAAAAIYGRGKLGET